MAYSYCVANKIRVASAQLRCERDAASIPSRESPLRLRLPPQFAIDLKTTHGHSIQQLEVAALDVEGNLARYETRGLRGWLFQPNVGQHILLVPSKAKILPETFPDIVSFDFDEAADFVNASAGTWLKTSIPTIRGNAADLSEPIDKVLASWTNAFSYRHDLALRTRRS
jgi:hypothetical protein